MLVEVDRLEGRGERLCNLVSLSLVLNNEGVKVLGETKLELGHTSSLLNLDVCERNGKWRKREKKIRWG